MNTFKNISSELKAFFNTNAVFKILAPIDVFFVFGGLIVLVLCKLNFLLVGDFFYTIGWYGLILGLILAFANYHLMYLYIGLFGSSLIFLVEFVVRGFTKYGYWSFYTLVTCLIGAALGYFVFRKSTVQSEG